MTVTIEPPGVQQPRFSRRTRGVIVAIGTLGLVVALGVGVRWWTHPDVIPDVGPGLGIDKAMPVDRAAVVVNVTPPTDEKTQTTFTVRHLSAHLDVNSAAATASFAICDVKQTGHGMFYLWRTRGLAQFCTDIRPVDGAFRFTYPGDQALLLTLTPTRPGRVHLDRVDISESLGKHQFLRRGTDTSAWDLDFTAR